MIELKADFEQMKEISRSALPLKFHPSFYHVQERLKKWAVRFSHAHDSSIFSNLLVLYLVSSKKFLDHRSYIHLFRMILSIHTMQNKLSHSTTFFPHQRNLEIRWIPTSLQYPFSTKPVLGCLIGFNVMDRYELFDEENILLALQKYLPELRLVKDSFYCHPSQHKNLKLIYLEIEKKDGKSFSHKEQTLLRRHMEEKVKDTIQTLSPTIFMSPNEEEIYKNILVLSQQIKSLSDLPQAFITLDRQVGNEIVFLVTLVYVSPSQSFSLAKCFSNNLFFSQRIITVKQIDNHPVEAHIFRFHFQRDVSLLRSNGSLNFYAARQKVVSLINSAIGEFRDYNGGIILKQQELLHSFKERYLELIQNDSELLESFFYAITPLEKQVILPLDLLCQLFSYFLENRKQKLKEGNSYNFKIYRHSRNVFLHIHCKNSLMKEAITEMMNKQYFKAQEIAYSLLEIDSEIFFACLFQAPVKKVDSFLTTLEESLNKCQQKLQEQQVLRIAMDFTTISLDPRIVGEVDIAIIRMLFEGLTRFNNNGTVENAIAESILISPDLKHYTFKLRKSFWNDGSPLTAYDFEYAWKKMLSPAFNTPFSHSFYPIKNAREAKEGKVSADQIGIHSEDDLTLKVELVHPASYFVQLTAGPHFSPINHIIDQKFPEWPYQTEKNYPCNGPFQLKISQLNQGFQLIRNPFYWDSQNIVLDRILLTYMNTTQALQAFQKKEVDWLGNPFAVWDPAYNTLKEDKIISGPDSRVCWCVFNTSAFPFNNPTMRQAFAYAIQRSKILKNPFLPLNPAYAPLLPRHRGDQTSHLFPEYNKEKAKELFNVALKELKCGKKNFKITLISNEIGIQAYVAKCLQQQLYECFGLECEMIQAPWSEIFKRLFSGNFEMGIVNWSSWIEDPIYVLDYFKNAKQGVNFCKWENTRFQHLIDLSEQEVDLKKRLSYLYEAEEILGNEMPIIPLFYFPYQALVNRNLNLNDINSQLSFNVAKSFYKK